MRWTRNMILFRIAIPKFLMGCIPLDGHILWQGGTQRSKYPKIRITSKHSLDTHVFAYIYYHGEVPEGTDVSHTCHVKHCIAEDHLVAETHIENMRRGGNYVKTHCKRDHPLSGDNLYVTPDNRRMCRECQRSRSRKEHQVPFIEQAVAAATEGYFVDEGVYALRIVSAEEKESKKGKPMIECVIEIVDHPDAEPIFHYINLATEDDSEKARKFKLRMTRRFLEVFNVPYQDDGFDSDDLNGAEGKCMVFQQERIGDDGQALDPPEYSHALRLPKFGGADEQEEAPRARGGRAAPATRRGRQPEPEPDAEEEVYDEQPPEEEEEQIEEEAVEEEEPPPPPVRRPARSAAAPARPSAVKTAAKTPVRGGPPPRRR